MTSFSQLHLSRNCCSRRSLDKINLYFLAFYTRLLIKKGEKCENLDKINLYFLAFYTRLLIKKGEKCENLFFFVGMENFTFREIHVNEKSMGKS